MAWRFHSVWFHSAWDTVSFSRYLWYVLHFVSFVATCFTCLSFRNSKSTTKLTAERVKSASHTWHLIIIEAKDAVGIVSPEESLAREQVFHNLHSELNQCISLYVYPCLVSTCPQVKIGQRWQEPLCQIDVSVTVMPLCQRWKPKRLQWPWRFHQLPQRKHLVTQTIGERS